MDASSVGGARSAGSSKASGQGARSPDTTDFSDIFSLIEEQVERLDKKDQEKKAAEKKAKSDASDNIIDPTNPYAAIEAMQAQLRMGLNLENQESGTASNGFSDRNDRGLSSLEI